MEILGRFLRIYYELESHDHGFFNGSAFRSTITGFGWDSDEQLRRFRMSDKSNTPGREENVKCILSDLQVAAFH